MLFQATRLKDFPTLETMTYLNTAAEGIPPPAVAEALAQYVHNKQRGMDGRPLHFAQWDSARALAGQLYGLSADEIAICSCTSEAYNLAAMALRLRQTLMRSSSTTLTFQPARRPGCKKPARRRSRSGGPWRGVAGRRPAALAWSTHPPDRYVARQLLQRLYAPTSRGDRGCAPHFAGASGSGRDASTGPRSLPLEGVDLIVSSTHKWILASHGGCLVGIPAAHDVNWDVPAGGWFNLQDPFGPGRFDRVISRSGAAGFMVGMPNFPAVYAIRAALDYITQVGVEAIDRAARPLVRACIDGLFRLPVDLLTPPESESLAGIVAFRHPESEELARRLQAQNIHLMSHAGRLRVSIHGYNTMSDIETLLVALDAALRV